MTIILLFFMSWTSSATDCRVVFGKNSSEIAKLTTKPETRAPITIDVVSGHNAKVKERLDFARKNGLEEISNSFIDKLVNKGDIKHFTSKGQILTHPKVYKNAVNDIVILVDGAEGLSAFFLRRISDTQGISFLQNRLALEDYTGGPVPMSIFFSLQRANLFFHKLLEEAASETTKTWAHVRTDEAGNLSLSLIATEGSFYLATRAEVYSPRTYQTVYEDPIAFFGLYFRALRNMSLEEAALKEIRDLEEQNPDETPPGTTFH